jgi:hypothetical protein
MKKTLLLLSLLMVNYAIYAQSIHSPNRNLKLTFQVNPSGEAIYQLDYKQKATLH